MTNLTIDNMMELKCQLSTKTKLFGGHDGVVYFCLNGITAKVIRLW